MADFYYKSLGSPFGTYGNATTLNNFAMNGTTDQSEVIFQAREAATITRLGYRLASTTGTVPQYKISLQGVNSAGDPDGTIKGGGSPASALFTPSGTATWNWVTLDNSYVCTRGELLAWVIAYNTGTINASNLATFTLTNSIVTFYGIPYSISNDAGARTRALSLPIWGYGSSGVAYGAPVLNNFTTTFNSDSVIDEYALRWVIPASMVSTYTVGGCRILGTAALTGTTYKVNLYSGTTVLQTLTVDSDHTVSAIRLRSHVFSETTLSTLSGGQEYRIGVQPQNTTTAATLYDLATTTAADREAFSGGPEWYRSHRADGGAWVDDTDHRPLMEIVIADWTVASGGLFPFTDDLARHRRVWNLGAY